MFNIVTSIYDYHAAILFCRKMCDVINFSSVVVANVQLVIFMVNFFPTIIHNYISCGIYTKKRRNLLGCHMQLYLYSYTKLMNSLLSSIKLNSDEIDTLQNT